MAVKQTDMGYPMRCDVCGVVYDSGTEEGMKQMGAHYKECPNAWWKSLRKVTTINVTKEELEMVLHYRKFGKGRRPKDARTTN